MVTLTCWQKWQYLLWLAFVEVEGKSLREERGRDAHRENKLVRVWMSAQESGVSTRFATRPTSPATTRMHPRT